MNRLRIAVVGAGHLGTIHARLLATLNSVELIGIADPDATARQRAAETLSVPARDDYTAFLGHIDAAVVATPTCHHHAVATDLLAHGIHVLVEKPITQSVAEADALIALAHENDCVLQVGHVERFNPAWNAVLPDIQQPRYIEAVRAGPYSFRSTDVSIVLDLMIHDIDLILSLVQSRVARVEAMGMALLGPRADLAHAHLLFENGCVAHLNASRVSRQPRRAMRVYGPNAFATIDFATGSASVTRPSAAVRNHQIDLTRCPPDRRADATRMIQESLLPEREIAAEPVNAILAEQSEFVAAIRSGRQVRVDGSQARAALAVADQILYSIETHRWNGTNDGPVGPRAVFSTADVRPRRAA